MLLFLWYSNAAILRWWLLPHERRYLYDFIYNYFEILWYLPLMVAIPFRGLQLCLSLFKSLSFAPVALPLSATLCFFLRFQFSYEIKEETLCSLLQYFRNSHLWLETWTNLDLKSFTKEIVIRTKNCSIVHICKKLCINHKLWIQ